jgi:Phage integrase, N-terminal SAM-like domain/Arm DNA-binding domain
MRGAVYKRGSTWTWHFDIDPDPLTGRRRQRTKGGYPTKKAAEQALAEAIGQWRTGRLPQRSTHTLSHFLQQEWLPAVKPRLRPSTWANYRTYTAAYVVPILGQIKLQALTPIQLNHLYAHLLEHGRRKTTGSGRTGLAPKTVRNVHLMLHRALHDAMRWGYLVRNVAEAADPPAAAPPNSRSGHPRSWARSSIMSVTTACMPCGCWSPPPGCAAASSPGCAGSTSTSTTPPSPHHAPRGRRPPGAGLGPQDRAGPAPPRPRSSHARGAGSPAPAPGRGPPDGRRALPGPWLRLYLAGRPPQPPGRSGSAPSSTAPGQSPAGSAAKTSNPRTPRLVARAPGMLWRFSWRAGSGA